MNVVPSLLPFARIASRLLFLVRFHRYFLLGYSSPFFLSDREYERSCAWFYSEAQGAITRFLVRLFFFISPFHPLIAPFS
jgi:hypothetical protein